MAIYQLIQAKDDQITDEVKRHKLAFFTSASLLVLVSYFHDSQITGFLILQFKKSPLDAYKLLPFIFAFSLYNALMYFYLLHDRLNKISNLKIKESQEFLFNLNLPIELKGISSHIEHVKETDGSHSLYETDPSLYADFDYFSESYKDMPQKQFEFVSSNVKAFINTIEKRKNEGINSIDVTPSHLNNIKSMLDYYNMVNEHYNNFVITSNKLSNEVDKFNEKSLNFKINHEIWKKECEMHFSREVKKIDEKINRIKEEIIKSYERPRVFKFVYWWFPLVFYSLAIVYAVLKYFF